MTLFLAALTGASRGAGNTLNSPTRRAAASLPGGRPITTSLAVLEDLSRTSGALARELHGPVSRPRPVLPNPRIRARPSDLHRGLGRGVEVLVVSALRAPSELHELLTKLGGRRGTVLLHEGDHEIDVRQLATGLGTETSSRRRQTAGIEIGGHFSLFLLGSCFLQPRL